MNEFILIDAISCLDADLLEKHFEQKEELKAKNKKRARLMKWTALAACLVVIAAIPIVNNLIGYNGVYYEDEMYERTHTEFQSYEDVRKVIGDYTLLENIDFSKIDNYTFILEHELDDISQFKELGYVNTLPNDSFGIGVYFVSSDGVNKSFCSSGNMVTINNIPVEVDQVNTDSFLYSYIAEFEYNNCKYVVRAYGNTSEEVFWNNLNELLGN